MQKFKKYVILFLSVFDTASGVGRKGRIMTNLEYLAWFLEETYGAICFHNDEADGYHSYPDGDERAIETLGVFFSNASDLEVPEIRERLEKKAGKDFYKRYQAAKDHSQLFLHGYAAVTAYKHQGKTLYIQKWHTPSYLLGEVDTVIEYFIGVDIELVLFKPMNPSAKSMPTNNGFCVPYGCSVKENLEKFLTAQGKPIISEENGFYVRPPRRRLTLEEEEKIRQRIRGIIAKVLPNSRCDFSKPKKLRFQREDEFMEEHLTPMFGDIWKQDRHTHRKTPYNNQIMLWIHGHRGDLTGEMKILLNRFHEECVKHPVIDPEMKYCGWRLPYLIQPTEMEEDQHYFDLWENGEPTREELK